MVLRRIPMFAFVVAFILSCTSELPTSNGDNPELTDEAKLAAIWLSDEPSYPTDLAWEIQRKLALLRDKYGDEIPHVKREFRYNAEPKMLIITFDSITMPIVMSGEYDDWNDLNEKYGVINIEISGYSVWKDVKLIFDDQINPHYLEKLYGELEGVRYAYANLCGGDGSNVYPWIVDGNLVFLVRNGYGDCPMGCLNNQFWYFKTNEFDIYFVGEFFRGDMNTGDPIPSWWHEIEPALCKFRFFEDTNCGYFGPWE